MSAAFSAFTLRKIVDADLLMADVIAGINRVWHMTVGENEPDVTALACTAKVARGVFIVVVAGPIHRLERKLEEARNLLKEVCRRIEASGWMDYTARLSKCWTFNRLEGLLSDIQAAFAIGAVTHMAKWAHPLEKV
jgi:hypothetical protein